MKKKILYIVLSILMLSLIVSFVDAVIQPNYFIKIPIKVVAFLLIPSLFFIFNKGEFKNFKQLFSFKKKNLLKSIILGILIYCFIVVGYFITKDIIDYSNVTNNLTNSMGITSNNFIYVSIYISLMNSFLEEFFFRGFGFIILKKYTSRKFAYIFSSSLFAIYHLGMLWYSFSFSTLLLLLIGLFLGGCIFSYLCENNNNIYPSWFVHMFTNFGINTVGFILFSI